MRPDDRVRWDHMIDAADSALQFVAGRKQEIPALLDQLREDVE